MPGRSATTRPAWLKSPVACRYAGLFLSRGRGMHETRTVDFSELIFVRRGRLAMQAAGRPYDVGAGEALILPAGVPHGGTGPYPRDLEFFWIHFDPPRGAPLAARHLRVRRPEVVEAYCRRLLDDRMEYADAAADRLPEGLLVSLLLAESWRDPAEAGAEVRGGAGADLANRARSWLLRHLDRPVGTATVARALRCNPDYLGRLYRRVHGRTLTGDVQRMRLDLVVRRLGDTRDAIGTIAAETGFGDAAYLRRLFRRRFGMGPRAWRQRHARGHLNTE